MSQNNSLSVSAQASMGGRIFPELGDENAHESALGVAIVGTEHLKHGKVVNR